jgi:hypothetical protein
MKFIYTSLLGIVLLHHVYAQEPSCNVSNLTFSNVTSSSMTLTWTNGCGDGRILFARVGSPVGCTPVDGNTYSFDTNYNFAPNPSGGGQCPETKIVYIGNSNTVTITGLSSSTTYHFRISEYNSAGMIDYRVFDAPFSSQSTTGGGGGAEPTCNVSDLIFSDVSSNSMTLTWINGCGDGRIVFAREFSISCDPIDGANYAFTTNYASAPSVSDGGGGSGSGCVNTKVVYRGTSNSVTITGLSSNTSYYFRVYEYSSSGAIDYRTSDAPSASQSTTGGGGDGSPSQQANNISTSVTENSAFINFTPGNGNYTLLAIEGNSSFTSILSNGQRFCVNTNFGSGGQVGGTAFAIMRVRSSLGGGGGCAGPWCGEQNFGTGVTVTNLQPATVYTVKAFEFNDSCSPIYNIDNADGNPITFTTLATEPTVQATGLTFVPLTSSSLKLTWTNGNGSERMVIARQDVGLSMPFDGASYTGNADFSAATDIGFGNKVVYRGTSNTVTVTNLNAATVYAFQVFEFNGNGATTNYLTTGSSISRRTLDDEPSAHAASFSSTTVSSSQINLSFSAANTIANADGYIILRRQDGAFPTAANVIDGIRPFDLSLPAGTTLVTTITSSSATTFNNTGLSAALNYTYALIPYNYNGIHDETYNYRTAATIPVFLTTTFAVEPSAQPTGINFNSLTTNSFNVTYIPASGSPSGYIAIRRTGSSPTGTPIDGVPYSINDPIGDGVVAFIGNSTNFPQSGLAANTVYFYDVFSYNGGGPTINYRTTSPLEGSRTTLIAEPTNQPTSINFTATTAVSMDVSFVAAAGGASGYLALRRIGSAPTGLPADGTAYAAGTAIGDGTVVFVGGATNFSQSDLSANTTYHYRVFAYNGSGGATNYLTTSPLSGSKLTLTVAPLAISASNITVNQFTANWNAVSGASEYRLDVSSDNFLTFIDGFNNLLVAGLSSNVTGLAGGLSYKYRVRALNNTGPSDNSNDISVLTVPETPTVLASTGIEPHRFTANWTTSPSATEYFIDVATNPELTQFVPGFQNKSTGSSTTVEVDGLSPGTNYYVSVRSRNASGTSLSSAPYNQISRCVAPDVLDASNLQSTYFKANWTSVIGAESYEVSLSNESNFSTVLRVNDDINALEEIFADLNPSTTYYYRVRAKNAAGYSAYSQNKIVRTNNPDGSTFNPPTVAIGSSTASTISATHSGGAGSLTLTLKRRGIISASYTSESPVNVSGSSTSISLSPSWLDALGMEYYFVISDVNNNRDSSARAYVYKPVAANEIAIPNLSFGGQVKNYRIISIPYDLEQKDVLSIFGLLGQYDPTKWRLIQYQNGYKDYPSFTQLALGKGYWFNAKEQVSISLGAGTAPKFNQDSPFTLSLTQGWNLIGNPYPFNINWSDILEANGSPSTVPNEYFVFNPNTLSYDKSNSLKPFEGGWVLANQNISLIDPVTLKNTSGGRQKADDTFAESLDELNWLVPVTLKQGEMTNTLSALGMHPDASVSHDRYDGIAPPHFFEYTQLSTDHPEFFIPQFVRDVVPTQQEYVWDFELETNRSGPVELTWNNKVLENNRAQLLLYDIQGETIIDMRTVGTYTIQNPDSRKIHFIYSSDEQLVATQLSKAYPNPFTSHVLLPGFLNVTGEPVNVSVKVHSSTGI